MWIQWEIDGIMRDIAVMVKYLTNVMRDFAMMRDFALKKYFGDIIKYKIWDFPDFAMMK